jgi:tetratricopeptide (TPR) repeat protein
MSMKSRSDYRFSIAGIVLSCLALTSCGGGQPSLSSTEQQLNTSIKADQKQYGDSSGQVADDLTKLGDNYRQQGRLADSEVALKHAVDIEKAQGDGATLSLARTMNSYGLTLLAEDDLQGSENVLQEALSIRESHKADAAAIAESQGSLGQLYYEGGVLPEAKQWFEKSFATIKAAGNTNSVEFAEAQNNLAGIDFCEGKFSEAEEKFLSSLNTYENALGHDRPEVADCMNNLGDVYRAEHKYPQSESQYQGAIAIYQKISNSHPNLAACLNNLALLYQNQNMYDKAEPLYKQALALEAASSTNANRDLTDSMKNYAKLLHATNRENEAKSMEARVNKLLASQS